MKKLFMNERHCPICGKEFFPTSEWVYKDYGHIYCSWKCYRRRGELAMSYKDGVGYPRKRVEQFTIDGTVSEFSNLDIAAAATGFPKSSIARACRGEKFYNGYYWRYVK